jgi:hypothetical protein
LATQADSNGDSSSQRLASAGGSTAPRLHITCAHSLADGPLSSSSNGSSNADGLRRTTADELNNECLITPDSRTDSDCLDDDRACLVNGRSANPGNADVFLPLRDQCFGS